MHFATNTHTHTKWIRLFQGIGSQKSTQNRVYTCNSCLCFCASRLSGRIWVCWRRRRTTNFVQSKMRYLLSFGVFSPLVFASKNEKSSNCCLFCYFPVTTTRNKTLLLLSERKRWIRIQMSFTSIWSVLSCRWDLSTTSTTTTKI